MTELGCPVQRIAPASLVVQQRVSLAQELANVKMPSKHCHNQRGKVDGDRVSLDTFANRVSRRVVGK